MKLLKHGLHPQASDLLRGIGITEERITQTIGTARASAGTHDPDGHVTIDGETMEYCAATDLSIHGMEMDAVRELLDRLGEKGFAAWARIPGRDHWPETDALHVHCVFSGVICKKSLREQIHAFCHGRNGLRSNAVYAFHRPRPLSVDRVRALFLSSGNPPSG